MTAETKRRFAVDSDKEESIIPALEQQSQRIHEDAQIMYEELVQKNKPIFEGIKNLKIYLERAKVPYQKKRHLQYDLENADKKSGQLISAIKSYSKTQENLKKIYGELEFINDMDPIRRNLKGQNYIKGKEEEKRKLLSERASYARKMEKLSKEIMDSLYDAKEVLNYHHEETERKGTKAERAVVIAIIGTFAGTLLYTLPQIAPENIQTGMFIAGSSPMIWVVLTAVVIFLAFFFMNHKLK